MTLTLPQDFLDRMQKMLQNEYEDFLESYDCTNYQSLRINRLKEAPAAFLEKNGQTRNLTPVPWTCDGFYYPETMRPGKHPYHEAGVYYIQEPSAMMPAVCLDAKPGERILDLCAAPGGKSTQIASCMEQQGILVSNEIHAQRAKILSENIERMGIRNAIVTNETPQTLATRFPSYFDRIMVDAPCSGEGMFRKNPEACHEWSLENVTLCGDRQDEILDCAHRMLRPGGRIVFSTCTFAPFENEGSIFRFLQRYPEYHVVPAAFPQDLGENLLEPGRPEWIIANNDKTETCDKDSLSQLTNTIRLWPHKIQGEGHFLAILEKSSPADAGPNAAGNSFSSHSVLLGGGIRLINNRIQTVTAGKADRKTKKENQKKKSGNNPDFKELEQFLSDYIKLPLTGTLIMFGEQIYLLPEDAPSLSGLRVLRPGLHLGTILKNRFEPSHALALSLKPENVASYVNLSTATPEEYRTVCQYINGQTFPAEGEKGWYLICVDGYSLGWGKLAGGIMKNHYPKGLRKALI